MCSEIWQLNESQTKDLCSIAKESHTSFIHWRISSSSIHAFFEHLTTAPLITARFGLTLVSGKTINDLMFVPSTLTAKHTVIRYFSWPVVLMGTIFETFLSTVVPLGISTHNDLSSMLAIWTSEKLNLSRCFSQNFMKLTSLTEHRLTSFGLWWCVFWEINYLVSKI